jgi:putative ABC transport system ATP-binding protein
LDCTTLTFEGVHRLFRRGEEEVHALRDVSFQAAGGECLAVVGPSGCGKSTLLSLVAGVDLPDSGRVLVCGTDLTRADEADLLRLRRECVGVVFQAFYLMPNLTVEANVALPLHLAGRPDPERVRALIERVGLTHRRAHTPAQLSGGEQQRAAVARALVHRPRVVVADEPTGNLDSDSGAAVVRLLEELRHEEGATVLIATHDAGLASGADRVLLLKDGRLVSDTPR